jgi:GR25 family glycosyltransferase involved in LPS biosynthesis
MFFFRSLEVCYLLQFLLLLQLAVKAVDEDCKWSKRDASPDVYFINMDKSADRKVNMERHLTNVGLEHRRIRGLTPKEIYIPEDIESTWRTAQCKLQTSWSPPVRRNMDSTSAYTRYTTFMTSLCGRGKKKNNPKELGCTTSHLMAMRDAVYSKSKSRYALIIEDDVQFPFDVDWNALALTAPKDFVILQLFNSNQATMSQTWGSYKKNNDNLWSQRNAMKFFDFWSTCAYLIDRVAMKPIIDKVIFDVNGWTSFNIIAGINMNPTCVPAECCINGTNYENFIHKAPCVWAPRGFQAGKGPLQHQTFDIICFGFIT